MQVSINKFCSSYHIEYNDENEIKNEHRVYEIYYISKFKIQI
jgi:hypothetical protein